MRRDFARPSARPSARPFALALLPVLLASLVTSLVTMPLAAEEPAKGAEKVDMAAMMARAQKLTQPGEKHKLLERFLGVWDTEFKITAPGMDAPPAKGTATISWLMPGRWLQNQSEGSFMGMPVKSFYILGYDNFKQSYVSMNISTLDTAMLTAEGDLDPNGKALVSYGTLDEYLTGENDKMVKTIWRFISPDEMLFEIYDLPIGEHNNQVIEMRYTRRKDASAGAGQ